jgi:hypothetical protein
MHPRGEMRVTKARTRAFALDSQGASIHQKPTLRTRFRSHHSKCNPGFTSESLAQMCERCKYDLKQDILAYL